MSELIHKDIITKTTSGTLGYDEIGDIICNSSSAIKITLPSPFTGMWFRINNINNGIVTVYYNSNLTTISKNEFCMCYANTTVGWIFTKSGGGGTTITKEAVENVLTGEILSHTHPTDVTKINIETVLTGEISSHSHAFNDNVLTGLTAPTTITVGTVGQFYLETTTPKLYQCTAINTGLYIWTEIGGGSGSYTLPQATETILGGIKAAEKTTAETQEVKIDSATGKLYSIPPTVAENGLPAGGSAGQVPVKNSANDYDIIWGDVSGSGTPKNRIYVPYGTANAYDDEFDDGVIDSNWNTINVSGYENTYYEPTGIKGLSGYFPSGKGAMKICGKVKGFTGLSTPFYIETSIKIASKYISGNFPSIGLVFSDSGVYGSGNQIIATYAIGTWSTQKRNAICWGQFTGFNARSSAGEIELYPTVITEQIYLRFVYESANTFRVLYSIDGIIWYDASGAISYTITPTYFGIIQTTSDANTIAYSGNWGYFRMRLGLSSNG